MSYMPKVYRRQGGDELVVADGGKVEVQDGGAVLSPIRIVTTSPTLDASESGLTIMADAADLVVALPATAAGLQFRFILGPNGLSTGTGLSLSPVAADYITGNGLTATDNKDLILAGASDRVGDAVLLVADGVNGWFIASVIGTWAKEA